ncbi:hypothetical protein BVC80_9037g35 [Macleaya cordata]|uniref:SHSP domain-containing protein n=1 Tax=Macleaya cordata TaxID=56857 RepID=A0A200Q5Q4_MACCD|nr:hypothetical protein BVC80_9037g35 [Macleaya cordata]
MANQQPSTPLHGTNSYVFTVEGSSIDVSEYIGVSVEDGGKVLEISYRRHNSYAWVSKRFELPQDANTDAPISAVYLNKELIVSVKKLNKPKVTQYIASD